MWSCLFLGRFWLVIKEDGHMVTARQEPRLVLVSITCEDDRLILSAPGMDQLVLPSKLPFSNTVHDCRCSAWGLWGPACTRCSSRLLPALGLATVCPAGDKIGKEICKSSIVWFGTDQ